MSFFRRVLPGLRRDIATEELLRKHREERPARDAADERCHSAVMEQMERTEEIVTRVEKRWKAEHPVPPVPNGSH